MDRRSSELFERFHPHLPFFLVKWRVKDHEAPLLGARPLAGAVLAIRTEGIEEARRAVVEAGPGAARAMGERLEQVYLRILDGAVHRYQGCLIGGDPSGLLAFFPARSAGRAGGTSPGTWIDDLRYSAERAIAASAWMNRSLKAVAGMPRVRLRLGVAAGRVELLTYPIRDGRRAGFLLAGEAVRSALELASSAGPHSTYVAPQTFQLLRGNAEGVRVRGKGVRLVRSRSLVKPTPRVLPRPEDLPPGWIQQTVKLLRPLLAEDRWTRIRKGRLLEPRVMRGATTVVLLLRDHALQGEKTVEALGRTLGRAIAAAEKAGALIADAAASEQGHYWVVVFPPDGGKRNGGRRGLLFARGLTRCLKTRAGGVRFSAGVAAGDLLVAPIGTKDRVVLCVSGPAVERALSLALGAPYGAVWAGDDVRGAAAPPVRLLPAGAGRGRAPGGASFAQAYEVR